MLYRINFIFVMGFCLMISLHFINLFLHVEPKIHLTENRSVSPEVKFEGSYSKFVRGYDAYFKDHFGFRNFLVYSSNLLLIKIFNQSSSDKVIIGKNKWLFFAGEDNAFHLKERKVSKDLLDLFSEKFRKWVFLFKNKNIPFVFFVAPDKQSIYPEYLKEPQASWESEKNYDMLASILFKQFGANFINVKPELLNYKQTNKKLYFKADSHWNDTSAFFVYKMVMKNLRLYASLKSIPILDENQMTVVNQIYTGDMIRIFWGISNLYDEKEVFLRGSNRDAIIVESHSGEYHGVPIQKEFYTTTNPTLQKQGKTLLAVRDSQFIPMIHLFAESFYRVILVNVWEDKANIEELIENEKPDAVIFESVERGLVQFLKKI